MSATDVSNGCGNCDICLGELQPSADTLLISQKILSCVLRVDEGFGVNHVCRVLCGSMATAVRKFQHHRLSTWGILKASPRQRVRDWIEQLVSQEFLTKVGQFQVLKVTESGRRVLRGKELPVLLQPARTSSNRHFSSALARNRSSGSDLGDGPSGRRDAYGNSRSDRSVGSYLRPRIRPPAKALKAFPLFREGLSLDEIAARLSRARSTIEEYLIDYIFSDGITDASNWVDPQQIARIEIAAQYLLLDNLESIRLKPIHDALHGGAGYTEIRVVLACRSVAERDKSDQAQRAKDRRQNNCGVYDSSLRTPF